MPRIPNEGLIPRGDKLIIRAFPKIAQRLGSELDSRDRAAMDAFLKILPGAIERYQAVSVPTQDVHESVESAIYVLQQSFGSRNAAAVESNPPDGTSNTPLEFEEIADGVGEPELPNGSDTDQSVASSALAHNDLQATAGSGGEVSHQQAGPRNPRVKRAPSSGRARYKQRLRELAESAGDQGRLSESEGGPNAKG